MGKPKESYNVVIFPNSNATEPYRFSFKKNTVKFIGFFSFVFLAVVAGFSVKHVQLLDQLEDVTALRKENKAQKIEIEGFSSTVDALIGKMVRLVEFDRKLRVMTDIGPPQAEVEPFGVGGSDERQGSFARRASTSIMQRDLGLLQAQVTNQEKSFQELEVVVQDRQSMWASTPSIWPTSGWLSSNFGKRVSPFSGRVTRHNGIDVAARPGTPIVAPASGVVTSSRFNGGFGKFLKLNHGYGIETHYGHLSKTAVKVGQKVKRGDVIAYVGNTGLSTGPHLHYEIIVNKAPVDPMRYILN